MDEIRRWTGPLRLAARLCVDSGQNRLQRAHIHPQSGLSGPNTYYVPSPGILKHQRLVVLKSVNCDSRVGFHDARDTGCKRRLMWVNVVKVGAVASIRKSYKRG